MRRSGLCSPQPWTSIPLCRVNMPWHTHASASTKVVYVFCLSHTLRHLARFLAPSRCYPSQTDSAVRPCVRSLLERSIRMPGTRFDGRFVLLPRSDRCPRPRDSVACHFLVYTRVCTRACVRACVRVCAPCACRAGDLLPSWAVLDVAGIVRLGGVSQERHSRVGDGAQTVAGRDYLQKGTGGKTITSSEGRRDLSCSFRIRLNGLVLRSISCARDSVAASSSVCKSLKVGNWAGFFFFFVLERRKRIPRNAWYISRLWCLRYPLE